MLKLAGRCMQDHHWAILASPKPAVLIKLHIEACVPAPIDRKQRMMDDSFHPFA